MIEIKLVTFEKVRNLFYKVLYRSNEMIVRVCKEHLLREMRVMTMRAKRED